MDTPTPETEHPWVRRSCRAGRPLIFAHRGGGGLAPENTWPAFEQAHALGVDGFELDVHVSRDGEVVVIHDADLRRTTDRQGRVSAMTADELLRADAGFHFTRPVESASSDAASKAAAGADAPPFPFRGRDARIPRLRDLLAAFPDELLIIELKGRDLFVAERALQVVREADALDRVCFGGFSGKVLRAVRRGSALPTFRLSDPRVCTSASREQTRWSLYGSWIHISPRWARWEGVRAFQVPEMAGSTRVVSPRFIAAAHGAGLLVQVWTVNDEADMRRLADWGVDGLITDRPDLARRVWPIGEPTLNAAAAGSRQSGTAAR